MLEEIEDGPFAHKPPLPPVGVGLHEVEDQVLDHLQCAVPGMVVPCVHVKIVRVAKLRMVASSEEFLYPSERDAQGWSG